jgi:hypothetical protein
VRVCNKSTGNKKTKFKKKKSNRIVDTETLLQEKQAALGTLEAGGHILKSALCGGFVHELRKGADFSEFCIFVSRILGG